MASKAGAKGAKGASGGAVAVVVVGALLLSAGLSACERLSCGPRAVLRLQYTVGVEGGPAPGPEVVARAGRVVEERLEGAGFGRSRVTPRAGQLVVEVDVPAEGSADELARARRVLSRVGRLEFRIVDDDERALYDRLGPFVGAGSGVTLVTNDGAPYLVALPGASGTAEERLAAVLASARAAGVDAGPDRELLTGLVDQGRFSSGGQPEAVRTYLVRREARVTGENVAEAHRAPEGGGPDSEIPSVAISFDDRGRAAFGELTRQNVGRRLAIVLDGQVTSAPVIQEAILGGQARITLARNPDLRVMQDEAMDLVIILESNPLPAPLVLVEESTIGPSQ
jgi:preprotein translocase subunit SecD